MPWKTVDLETITVMNSIADMLNNRIDLMQAERSPFAHQADRAGATQIAMLQFAAGLKSLRAEATDPDAGFVSGLRARMLAGLGPDIELRNR